MEFKFQVAMRMGFLRAFRPGPAVQGPINHSTAAPNTRKRPEATGNIGVLLTVRLMRAGPHYGINRFYPGENRGWGLRLERIG